MFAPFSSISDGQTPFVLLSLDGGDTKRDDKDVLPRQKCLDALAALRHAKWFQVLQPLCILTERVRTPLHSTPLHSRTVYVYRTVYVSIYYRRSKYNLILLSLEGVRT